MPDQDPPQTPPTQMPLGGDGNNKNLIPINIEDEMRRSYLDYAMSVIVGRALPTGSGSPTRRTNRGIVRSTSNRFQPAGRSGRFRRAAAWPRKWPRDGKELFFSSPRKMMAVEVKAGATFQAGVPQPLFDTGRLVRFTVTRDGQRFLLPARQAPRLRPW